MEIEHLIFLSKAIESKSNEISKSAIEAKKES